MLTSSSRVVLLVSWGPWRGGDQVSSPSTATEIVSGSESFSAISWDAFALGFLALPEGPRRGVAGVAGVAGVLRVAGNVQSGAADAKARRARQLLGPPETRLMGFRAFPQGTAVFEYINPSAATVISRSIVVSRSIVLS